MVKMLKVNQVLKVRDTYTNEETKIILHEIGEDGVYLVEDLWLNEKYILDEDEINSSFRW